MDDKRYNGWTNHETWCVALHIGNEQSSQEYWDCEAQRCWEDRDFNHAVWTPKQAAKYMLADALKEAHERASEDVFEGDTVCGVFSDLLGSALGAVNWHEIAEHLLEDMVTTEEVEA